MSAVLRVRQWAGRIDIGSVHSTYGMHFIAVRQYILKRFQDALSYHSSAMDIWQNIVSILLFSLLTPGDYDLHILTINLQAAVLDLGSLRS